MRSPPHTNHVISIACGKPRKYGFSAASFEYNADHVLQNILTGVGFAYGLALTLRLYKHATCQHAALQLTLT